MCIDFRLLNKNTKQDRFPLPRINNIQEKIISAHYFTKIDLENAYHKVEIAPTDQNNIDFYTRQGFF